MKDPLLQLLIVLGVLMGFLHPDAWAEAVHRIHLPTLEVLGGLMLLTQGIEQSRILPRLGRHLLDRVHSERSLARWLTWASIILSTFLTNDIALFVVVPLTLALRQLAPVSWRRLIVFEALGVNVGSLLSPIGNPQNIYLWQLSHSSFLGFIEMMAPWGLVLLAGLALLVELGSSRRPIVLHLEDNTIPVLRGVFWVSLGLYLPFLGLVETGHPAWALVLALGLGVFRPLLLRFLDWGLLVTFTLFFVDVGLLSSFFNPHRLPGLGQGSSHIALFLWGIILSQGMSNVPATLFMAPETDSLKTLAYGVNAGGFGLFVGSMANLIALRMAGDRQIWREFHALSFPFLLFAAATGVLFL
ncbi:SLC13 family permease [Ferrovum sp.]|jgi:Na+/H+ antiporter NhaD/arsenite permease-like protein|uniref:SLC13 family permease n=1 Tax=Ferrovum sp. TaxID=2609467 RepID=UPI00262D7D28|nr:SLC13 family permease [Ferrovum sp.]